MMRILIRKMIDMFIIGNHMPQSINMGSLYTQLSKWLGTEMKAGVQISTACASTNVGATLAAAQIASGVCKKVLVVGLEVTQSSVKGRSQINRIPMTPENIRLWTDFAVNQPYAVQQGFDMLPIYDAFLDLGYSRKYGYFIEEYDRGMMEVCRTFRLHASLTPKALIQETLENEAERLGYKDFMEFWKSAYNPFLAWPTRLRSVITACDGATAMVLSNHDGAKEYSGTPIELMGWGISVGDLPWYREDPTIWPSDVSAFAKAYSMSGISIEDVGYLYCLLSHFCHLFC
ncbi:hypothetical protein IEO70_15565 [Bacillus sp. AGMB 02131]|uniref:Thiolase N-terminal domain-containing protein n=1 Tax=Peribacillus faecalis TaxID=2772559 RepID=A0A927CXX3_9BACI|nr:hypothetical protein [Peribacillus faecalis]MBD3109757.1 hypothetical protein [Peribacillus faecalis]